jgi:hypothetical protein
MASSTQTEQKPIIFCPLWGIMDDPIGIKKFRIIQLDLPLTLSHPVSRCKVRIEVLMYINALGGDWKSVEILPAGYRRYIQVYSN